MQIIAQQVQSQPARGLLDLASLPSQCGGGEVDTRMLLHFLYKSPSRAQVIAPKLAASFDTLLLQQVSLQLPCTVVLLCLLILTAVSAMHATPLCPALH